MPTETEKVVCYVVRDGRLLVFTHDDLPLQVTGVQVPAGTVKPGEGLENAAVRELFEETGLRAHRIHYVGTHPYDLRPARNEIAVRHYFLMEPMSYPTDADGQPRNLIRQPAGARSAGPVGGCRCSMGMYSPPVSARCSDKR